MMTKKLSLSALDMAVLIAEIKPIIVGSYLSKIYQIDEVFIFRLITANGDRRDLIMSPKHGFWLTKYKFKVPEIPPAFCQQLRRKLIRLKLIDIKQHDLDRVVFFKFGNYTLVLEVVREGNLILLDENSRILFALRYMKMRDRDVLPGVEYKPPPLRGANILELTFEDFMEAIKELSNSKITFALLKVLALPRDSVEFVLSKLGISYRSKVGSLNYEQLRAIYDELVTIVKKCLNVPVQGVIVHDNGIPVKVLPYNLVIAREPSLKLFESFNESIDEYFSKLITEELEIAKKSKFYEELDKLNRVLDRQKRLKEEYEEKASKLRVVANELYRRLHELAKLFKEIKELRDKGYSWDLIKQRILELQLDSIRIIDVNLANNELIMEVKGTRVSMDLRLSVGDNLSKLYDRAKTLEKKCKRIDEEMKVTLGKIEELKKLQKIDRQELIIGIIRKKEWYEKFRWFISSGGFLVIAGRDAGQNEKIVRRYLEDEDVFLHADIYGAPVVVIKTHGKQIDETTLREAAEFAASFSRAWELGFSAIDVYWVKGSQVSKSPPSGLYLPKGSFMIYGKRNYLKGVKLAVAIGITLFNGEIKLLCGPVSSIRSHCEKYVVLAPGGMDRTEVAKRIVSIFTEYVRRKYPQAKIRIPLNDVLALLPRGRSLFLMK